ncbi:flagellar basal body-associated FliL family protein [Demequina aestuarii]|uniref:flagellar basal body-associated FliL family protein n=1 Tax=Demequina aestuarii TaxID=327095 RepID=UPI0007854C85|nr:flagellar basal body-associated FliL family protein [Demequina aestuarii]
MSEPRVIAPKAKIGARPNPVTAPEAEAPAAESSKRRLPSLIIGAVLLVAAVGAYWFLMGPGATPADGAEAEVEEVELGPVQTLESVSINLAGGHYLRLGLGLQTGASGHGELDGAVALDAAIGLFSGKTKEELADPEVRETLKHELLEAIEEPYHGEVLGVYYTDFVTQ